MLLKKDPSKKITILTCYDFPTARALDNSDIDIIFVGDSVGTNVLGYRSEIEVTMSDMIHHLKAVRKGVTQKILMVDMPYSSYNDIHSALANAKQLKQKGADIIKLEGGKEISSIVSEIVKNNIPVMAHIGFMPQLAKQEKRAVVGALAVEAKKLYKDALALQAAGACSIVFECVPEDIAKEISTRLTIPTIGIGSGKYTDGQVLVFTDVVGWYNMPYRFVKRYDTFYERTIAAANSFKLDVNSGEYPQRNHGFRIKAEEFKEFRRELS
ncbi:MAG: 3-methyl-2-oxobutanoate hydroxymethyltransferase [Fibrobacteres bacterium]|nr:3-methyl-2-oxobutanoate hydroxymethyltransferase [Fibrobacterota bacterium]